MSSRSSKFRRNSLLGRQSFLTQDGGSDSEGTHSDSHARDLAERTLSTSLSQRIPARSFSHHAPFAHNDTAQYSYQGVREQTAELASIALQDADSARTGTSPHWQSQSIQQGFSSHGEPTTLMGLDETIEAQARYNSSGLPEVIEETSEPVSPANELERRDDADASQPSALSNLFERSSRHASVEALSHLKQKDRTGRSTGFSTGEPDLESASENTPLIPKSKLRKDSVRKSSSAAVESDVVGQKKQGNQFQQMGHHAKQRVRKVFGIATTPSSWSFKAAWTYGVKKPVGFLPCVFLGVLLNVLDGLSYGMILFPLGDPIFEKTGADGLSMFYISCIVSQLTFSLGGSIFKGAVGSEMIEVVPFFHKMAFTIINQIGREDPHAVMATVITSYAMSSILTGVVFFLLGALKLGSLVNFFPRHILIGCIGGVGFFLFVTGIEISARLDGNLTYTLDTLKELCQPDKLMLWLPPLGLAIILTFLKNIIHSQYLVPAFFVGVAAIFYILVAAIGPLNLELLRGKGFIFDQVPSGVPWYHFYGYYDFNAVNWKSVWSNVPAMLALTFFGILHVPINVPALGIAAQEDDVNLNRELAAHGISNALSGAVGSIQNYLVYVNSQMFIQNGGNSRMAGLLLAAATAGVLVAGPDMIGYVPIMVVGALIYYLGIELLQEALVDTWGKLNKLEYLTVLVIVLVMGIYDFVQGILVGIVLACLNYVIQTSRKSAIRSTFHGDVITSMVRRHPMQKDFLRHVGTQIIVEKLMGFLFFGSIVQVEKSCRALIEEEAFRQKPIRYLVFDLAHVNGMDYSAAEAFQRLERLLGRKQVQMIFSGVERNDEVGKSLRSIGLWQEESTVRFFETLNSALEFCENEQLKAFYERREEQSQVGDTPKSSLDVPKRESLTAPAGGVFGSPRHRDLREAANTTLDEHKVANSKKLKSFSQPLRLILQAFGPLTEKNEDFWFQAASFFEKKEYAKGVTLYSTGEKPGGFYLLEEGMLLAYYDLPQGQYHETILPGTTCGELPFFSETPRTATVTAEVDCVAWLIDRERWERMQEERPEVARELLKIAIKLTSERMDSVTSYVLTAAG